MDFFDLHCDTIYTGEKEGQRLRSNKLAVSLNKGKCFDRWCQTFAIFIPDEYRGRAAIDLYERLHKRFLTEMHDNSDVVSQCRNSDEIRTATSAGKCAAILSVEGGAALGGNLSMLDKLYDDGVKMITLTWNGDNELASGVGGSGGGLTDFGRQVVLRMNELGILCDVSHLNERCFWELIDMGIAPVVATHSNYKSVLYHRRNLTDEQFKAVCRTGGVAGLNFYNEFLGRNTFDDVLRHLNKALELGGEDNVAFGSDYDGSDIDFSLDSIDKMPDLCNYLVQHGINGRIIQKLCFENALRLFR